MEGGGEFAYFFDEPHEGGGGATCGICFVITITNVLLKGGDGKRSFGGVVVFWRVHRGIVERRGE